jgi:hypothetical protein
MLPGRCSLELSGRKLQRKIKSHKLRAYPDFLLRCSRPRPRMWFFSKENHTQLIEVTTLDRKSGGAEGSAVPLDRTL